MGLEIHVEHIIHTWIFQRGIQWTDMDTDSPLVLLMLVNSIMRQINQSQLWDKKQHKWLGASKLEYAMARSSNQSASISFSVFSLSLILSKPILILKTEKNAMRVLQDLNVAVLRLGCDPILYSLFPSSSSCASWAIPISSAMKNLSLLVVIHLLPVPWEVLDPATTLGC